MNEHVDIQERCSTIKMDAIANKSIDKMCINVVSVGQSLQLEANTEIEYFEGWNSEWMQFADDEC